jgi:hypothetical protein
MVLASSLLLAPEPPVKDTADEQVREVVGQFIKALQAKDGGALMKTVDVPWFHDGKEVLRDRDKLKGEFEKIFQEKNLGELRFEIDQVLTYARLLEQFGDKVRENDRKLMDEVVSKDDRAVLLSVSKPGRDGKEKVLLLVRTTKGAPRVVGVRD